MCSGGAGCWHSRRPAVELFKGDLAHDVMFSCEYYSWVQEWKECSTTIPATLVGAHSNCSSLSYPNLAALLKIALSLPITCCESERSFSQLKLIKNARRSTMTESRLSSLALMKINTGPAPPVRLVRFQPDHFSSQSMHRRKRDHRCTSTENYLSLSSSTGKKIVAV